MRLPSSGSALYVFPMEPRSLNLSVFVALFGLAGCVTTEEETPVAASHLGEEVIFQAADTDQSGHLTPEEVALHYHQEVLAKYDQDRDQHITEAEWRAQHPDQTSLDPRFVAADTNRDKRVSKEEMAKWVTTHVSFGDAFKKYDQDGDFRLHWKELDANAPTELRVTMFSLPIG